MKRLNKNELATVTRVGEDLYILEFIELATGTCSQYNRLLTRKACEYIASIRVCTFEDDSLWDGPTVTYEKCADGWYRYGIYLKEYLNEYVYFISCNDRIKIGMTKGNPKERLQQLQTGAPYPLELVAYYIAPSGEERKLHTKFRRHRLHLEWFTYAGEIREYIDSLPMAVAS